MLTPNNVEVCRALYLMPLQRTCEEFYNFVTLIQAPLQWKYNNLFICSTVPWNNARQVCESFQPVVNESPIDTGT